MSCLFIHCESDCLCLRPLDRHAADGDCECAVRDAEPPLCFWETVAWKRGALSPAEIAESARPIRLGPSVVLRSGAIPRAQEGGCVCIKQSGVRGWTVERVAMRCVACRAAVGMPVSVGR
jgi:hypothetical protein